MGVEFETASLLACEQELIIIEGADENGIVIACNIFQ